MAFWKQQQCPRLFRGLFPTHSFPKHTSGLPIMFFVRKRKGFENQHQKKRNPKSSSPDIPTSRKRQSQRAPSAVSLKWRALVNYVAPLHPRLINGGGKPTVDPFKFDLQRIYSICRACTDWLHGSHRNVGAFSASSCMDVSVCRSLRTQQDTNTHQDSVRWAIKPQALAPCFFFFLFFLLV